MSGTDRVTDCLPCVISISVGEDPRAWQTLFQPCLHCEVTLAMQSKCLSKMQVNSLSGPDTRSSRFHGARLNTLFNNAQPRRGQLRCITVMKGTGKFFVGGNWKSNGTLASVEALVGGLNKQPVPADVEAVIAPVFLHLPYVLHNVLPQYQVAAQNCWEMEPGAWTGEVRRRLPDVGKGHSSMTLRDLRVRLLC